MNRDKRNAYLQAMEYAPGYDEGILRKAIDRLFSFLEIEKELKPEMKILLKPNLLGEYDPYFAVTTNPAVVAAVADWLVGHGFKNILIADSPGGSVSGAPDFDYDMFYKRIHYDLLENEHVKLNRDKTYGEKKTAPGFQNQKFHFLNAVLQADYIINIPKLKTHVKTTISFGIKNLFGCVPDMQKPLFHAKYPRKTDFNNMLVELAQTVSPHLTVIDAVDIMEGNGPSAGEKRKLGMLFAAKDVFSQDYFIAKLLGINPAGVEMLCIAKEKGLIHSAFVCRALHQAMPPLTPLLLPDLQTSATVGEKVTSYYHLLLNKMQELLLHIEPVHVPENCNLCMRCVHSCPVQAITVSEDTVSIRYDKCIGCLCCHEICSNRAMKIHKSVKLKR